MWRILLLLWTSWIPPSEGEIYSDGFDSLASLADFNERLQKATLEVIGMRDEDEDYSYTGSPFPNLQLSMDSMHSYIPNTGVGNREEVVVEEIKSVPISVEPPVSKWRYLHFNNNDYFMAIHREQVFLWKTSVTKKPVLDFRMKDTFCTYDAYAGSIIDAKLFTRHVNHLQILTLAVLSFEKKGHLINLYEVFEGYCTPEAVLEVKGIPIKVDYISSPHGGTLVIFFADGTMDTLLLHIEKGRTDINQRLEVHAVAPVDMVTFTVNGYGYVAVANRTTCEVYKLDQFSPTHVLFDSINVEDIVDLENFRLGFDHFLAVAGVNEQFLYVWRSGAFMQKQQFTARGAIQWHGASLTTCRDEVLLHLVTNSSTILFGWHGQKREFRIIPQELVPRDLRPAYDSMTSFSYTRTSFILLTDRIFRVPRIFSINTRLETVTDPVVIATQATAEIMREMKEQFEQQEGILKEMNSVLERAVKPHGDQEILTSQTFGDLSVMQKAVANSAIFLGSVTWQDSTLSMEDLVWKIEDLESNITKLENDVSKALEDLDDVAFLDETTTISGYKTIYGGISANSLVAKSLYADYMSGINLRELMDKLYRIDKPRKVMGETTFVQPVTVLESLSSGTINGIDFETEVLTTNTDQLLTGPVYFKSPMHVEGDLTIGGTLNGVDLSEEVVTLDGDHVITGFKNFTDPVVVVGNVTTGLIDGVDIVELNKTSFTISGDQTIEGLFTFEHNLKTTDITIDGTVNGIDVSDMAAEIVRVDVPAVVTGPKTFLDDLTIEGDLFVEETLNGLIIPEDLWLSDRDKVLSGRNVFSGLVWTEDDVTVEGKVDGLTLPDDVVTLTGDETIYGRKVFTDGINVAGDMTIGGLLDGIDLAKLPRVTLTVNETHTESDIVFLGPVTVTGNLNIDGKLNSLNFSDLLDDLVMKGERVVDIMAPKYFDTMTARQVNTGLINGYDINRDFMTVRGDQLITGTTIFEGPVYIDGKLNTGGNIIDNVDIVALYNSRIPLSSDGPLGSLELTDELIVLGNLNVTGLVDRVHPHNLVLKSVPQDVGKKTFLNGLEARLIKVSNEMWFNGSINGINLTDIERRRVTLSGDQELFGEVTLCNSVVAELHADTVNGIDLQKFASTVLSLTRDQEVLGPKNFLGPVHVFGDITTTNGLNGYNLRAINESAIKLNERNFLTGPVSFERSVIITGDLWAESINDVDLLLLNSTAVKKTGLQIVEGPTIFLAGFEVKGDIVAELVNGLRLDQQMLTRTTDQTLKGNFNFRNVTFEQNVEVRGLVNGYNINNLKSRAMRVDRDNMLLADVTFTGPVRILMDLNVDKINDIDLQELRQEVLLLHGHQNLTGVKVIEDPVIVFGDISADMINGLDWLEFKSKVLRVDQDQVIPGDKVFLNDVMASEVIVTGHTTLHGLLNGMNLDNLLSEAVFIDQPTEILGTKIFTGSVVVGDMSGRINGLLMSEDVVTLSSKAEVTQVISGTKTFHDLTLMADLQVVEFVNGYKLPLLAEDTLTKTGDQTITGTKTFKGTLTVLGDLKTQTVNEISLLKEVVTLHDDNVILGDMIVENDLRIIKDLTVANLLNNVDVGRMAREAIYLDTDQTITAQFALKNVQAKNINVAETVNGLDLDKLDAKVDQFWSITDDMIKNINVTSEDHCKALGVLHEALESSYYILDKFVVHQNLPPANSVSVSPGESGFTLRTSEGPDKLSSFGWDDYEQLFMLEDFLPKIPTLQLATFSLNGHIYQLNMALANGSESTSTLAVDGQAMYMIPSVLDVATTVLSDGSTAILVVLTKDGKCLVTEVTEGLREIEVLHVGLEATAVEVVQSRNGVYIIVARHFQTACANGSSLVYRWTEEGINFVQTLPAKSSNDVVHFLYQGRNYLALVDVSPPFEALEPHSIQVYRECSEPNVPFVLFQKISFADGISLTAFSFGGLPDQYLLATSKDTIQLFQLEGEAGFRATHTLCVANAEVSRTLVIDDRLFLIVAQGAPHNSVVYRGIMNGARLLPRSMQYC